MQRIKKNVFAILMLLILASCIQVQTSDGPYFGNGFHNGWADQTSIVLWSRLTQIPELNANGEKFIIPSSEIVRQLDKKGNKKEIFEAQIPEGFELNQMEGACPGSYGEIKLKYYPILEPGSAINVEWISVDSLKNYTCQWKLNGLSPDTKYVVEMFARKNKNFIISDSLKGAFRTPPTADVESEIEFCIVTCHDYPRRDDSIRRHKIYKEMMRMFPDFYVHTGDVEYYDQPYPYSLTEELMYFKWDRIFALPYQRDFYKQITSYFIKDDHDVLRDDAYPGLRYGTVGWERGLEIFDKEQFPTNDKPYKTIRWGRDLQVWITEGRNFRSKNTMVDGPGKTIWGKEQKEWLFKTLKESDATFKIIISPDPILGPDRDNKRDNYSNSNWKFEGNEIRNYLNQFDNLIICNGDRHWQYVAHPEDTNLWEFGCGPGSDSHAGGWSPDNFRPEHRFLRVKGGFLTGQVKRENETISLTFQHCDVQGNVVHEEVFKR